MNLFNNLKGTLTNVKSDLTSSFQPKNSTVKQEKVPGEQLLSRYADYWKELCLNTDSMGKQAEACDKVLTALNFKVIQKKADFFHVVSELNSLGKAVAEVETIKLRLADINKSCEQLEVMLVDLEGLNLRCRHAAMLENMERKFNEHRNRRIKEHDNSKRLLAEEHRKNLERLNEEMSWRKSERQKVFEEAHKQEMDIYRTLGSISYSSVHYNNLSNFTDLSTIELDDELGKTELEHFLGSSEDSTLGSDEERINDKMINDLPLDTEFNAAVACDEDFGNNNVNGLGDLGGDNDIESCRSEGESATDDGISHLIEAQNY